MKYYIILLFKRIRKLLFDFANIKGFIICISFSFLSSIFLLTAGATNNSTLGYKCASYYANIVLGDENINNVALTVEQNSKNLMPDTATELRSLYGAFGNRETNYAGTINAEKKKQITFVDYPFEANISFVYIQSGVQVSKSKVDKNHFRAEFYPLDLMFDYYANDPYNFFSFLYLSTGQARFIIDYIHPGLFDKDIPLDKLSNDPLFINVCKDELIGKGLNLRFDGIDKCYQVTNIFYEEYYFYNTVYEAIGDFMVGYNQYPEGFSKQATYFLNEYEYQNEFYLNYVKEKYKASDYLFSPHNIKYSGVIESDSLNSFLNNKNNVVSILFVLISVFCILSSLYIFFRFRLFKITVCFYFTFSFLLPYFVGSIIRLISKNIYIFSPFYTIGVLISMIVANTFFIIFFAVRKHSHCKEEKHD